MQLKQPSWQAPGVGHHERDQIQARDERCLPELVLELTPAPILHWLTLTQELEMNPINRTHTVPEQDNQRRVGREEEDELGVIRRHAVVSPQ